MAHNVNNLINSSIMLTFYGAVWLVGFVIKPFMDQWDEVLYVFLILLSQLQLYVYVYKEDKSNR